MIRVKGGLKVFGNQLFLSRMSNCHFRSPAISSSRDLYRLNLYKRILPILYSAEARIREIVQ